MGGASASGSQRREEGFTPCPPWTRNYKRSLKGEEDEVGKTKGTGIIYPRTIRKKHACSLQTISRRRNAAHLQKAASSAE